MPFSGTANDSPYPEGIEAQTHQVMKNLTRVLKGCGLTLANVLQCRVYLLHFERDYAAMNAVYASHFPSGRRPARTCVGVSGLARGALVEIDMVARRVAADSSGPP
jgi:enamine deaminase RidA (YjgF/YER057c/UK114 family)